MSENDRPVLVIGHPGHELRVFGWLRRVKPRVHILTDGGGRAGAPRVAASIRLIEAEGATIGEIRAPLTDREAYAAMLRGDAGPFLDIAARLADDLRRSGATFIAGDAFEGYNPTHDACRAIIDAVVDRLQREGRTVANHDFPLVGPPDAGPGGQRGGAVVVTLDEHELAHKVRAGHAYSQLEAEVTTALVENGAQAFAVECLRPAEPLPHLLEAPFYERYGERQVAAGHYREVLRYREHFVPLARALRAWGERGAPCAS